MAIDLDSVSEAKRMRGQEEEEVDVIIYCPPPGLVDSFDISQGDQKYLILPIF